MESERFDGFLEVLRVSTTYGPDGRKSFDELRVDVCNVLCWSLSEKELSDENFVERGVRLPPQKGADVPLHSF